MRNAQRVAGVLGIMALVLATGAWAEILGIQPGTSSNPKDNVPKEIQRSDPSGVPFGPGGTGPGTRGNALTGGRAPRVFGGDRARSSRPRMTGPMDDHRGFAAEPLAMVVRVAELGRPSRHLEVQHGAGRDAIM